MNHVIWQPWTSDLLLLEFILLPQLNGLEAGFIQNSSLLFALSTMNVHYIMFIMYYALPPFSFPLHYKDKPIYNKYLLWAGASENIEKTMYQENKSQHKF